MLNHDDLIYLRVMSSSVLVGRVPGSQNQANYLVVYVSFHSKLKWKGFLTRPTEACYENNTNLLYTVAYRSHLGHTDRRIQHGSYSEDIWKFMLLNEQWHEKKRPLSSTVGLCLPNTPWWMIIHNNWPVKLDKIIAYMLINIFHCIASKTLLFFCWKGLTWYKGSANYVISHLLCACIGQHQH